MPPPRGRSCAWSSSARGEPVIAVHGQLLAGRAGGIEANLLGLLAALAAREDSGRQVVIGPGAHSDWLRPYLGPRQTILPWTPISWEVAPPPAPAGWVPRGLPAPLRRVAARLFPAPSPERMQEREGRALTRALREAGVRAIHFPYQRFFHTDLPYLFEPWDLQHRHMPGFFTDEEIARREELYPLACRGAGRVVVASEWTRSDLVAQLGVPAEKIEVIRRGAGVPGRRWPSREEAESVLAGRALPPRFALYPAKTWPHKNHLRLLEAIAVLRSRGVEVPLVCPGGGVPPHDAVVQAAHDRLGLRDLVTFPGHVTAEELAALYRRADLLVFPSLFEGLGIPVLEALEAGLPVACADVTCLPEVAGDAAVLFDPREPEAIASALHGLWHDPASRRDRAARGLSRVAAFDWAAAGEAFSGLHAGLAGSGGAVTG